ncbi:MAG: BrnT family toxin [Treponema sp.]|nr:BrnT family toxin [Treponema sp.]
MEVKFIWDDRKNAINIMKHGVSFSMAAMVFSDPKFLCWYDSEHSSISEDRWRIIGLSGCDVLIVIYTEQDNFIRIISARKASKKEKEKYYYGYL